MSVLSTFVTSALALSTERQAPASTLTPLAIVEPSREKVIAQARTAAQQIAREKGTVTYDDVYSAMRSQGYNPDVIGNAAGSIFRNFEPSGLVKSELPSNRGRKIKVWKLRANVGAVAA